MATSITLHDSYAGDVTIPVPPGPPAREIGPDGRIAACVLSADVSVAVPIRVKILLRTDGTWVHWSTSFDGQRNCYLHIEQAQRGPITEAQRRTLAGWWLKREPSPYGLPIGATVFKWAFADFDSPDEVSAKYGDGSRVYLA